MQERPKPDSALSREAFRPQKGRALFVSSIASGAFIWFASPYLLGEREPWDASGNFYELYLLSVGILGGLMLPRRWWLCPLGVWLGQAIGLLSQPKWGPLLPLGIVFSLPLTSFVSLVGALLGVTARKMIASQAAAP